MRKPLMRTINSQFLSILGIEHPVKPARIVAPSSEISSNHALD